MISLKNKELNILNTKQLCELHCDKKKAGGRLRLSIFKSQNFVKLYHPLKRRKVKLERLKFVPAVNNVNDNRNVADKFAIKNVRKVLSERRSAVLMQKNENINWVTETQIINWLLSVGVHIKKLSSQKYYLKNRICLLGNVLVFANKKRTEMGLAPFYLSEFTEF